jgi:hypothetical protein
MARKKERKVRAVYTVFEYEDGGPMEAILPDGRMALLMLPHDLYECTSASVMIGAIARRRGGKIEIVDDDCSTLEDAREHLEMSGYDPEEVRRMKLELRPLISFD